MAEHDRRVYWQTVTRRLYHASSNLRIENGGAGVNLDWPTIEVLAKCRGFNRHGMAVNDMVHAVHGIFFPPDHT